MKKTKTLETTLTISGGLLVFYIIFRLEWLLFTSLGLIVIGLFIPPIAKGITFLWLKLAEGMGFVSSKILLTLIFFIFLTPIALLQKLLKKSTIQIKKTGKSMYSERKHEYVAADFENPW